MKSKEEMHICTCDGCKVEPFMSRCKYEELASELLEAAKRLTERHMWEPGDEVGSGMVVDVGLLSAAIAKTELRISHE